MPGSGRDSLAISMSAAMKNYSPVPSFKPDKYSIHQSSLSNRLFPEFLQFKKAKEKIRITLRSLLFQYSHNTEISHIITYILKYLERFMRKVPYFNFIPTTISAINSGLSGGIGDRNRGPPDKLLVNKKTSVFTQYIPITSLARVASLYKFHTPSSFEQLVNEKELFTNFKSSNSKEQDLELANLLLKNIRLGFFGFSKKRELKVLISQLELLDGEYYKNKKYELVVKMANRLEDMLRMEGIKNKNSWMKKTAVGVLTALSFGMYAPTTATKINTPNYAWAEESAQKTDEFYENLAKQMEAISSKKNPDKVIEIGEKYADDEENKSGYFYNQLGVAYIAIKDFKNAEKILKKGIEVGSDRQPLYNSLGVVYYKQGEKEKAIEEFKYALDLNPNSEYAEISRKWLAHLGIKY